MQLANVMRTTRAGPANIGSGRGNVFGGLTTSSRAQVSPRYSRPIGLPSKAENNKNSPILYHTQKLIQMDNQLNVKVKTIKQLEENIGAYFPYFEEAMISETLIQKHEP